MIDFLTDIVVLAAAALFVYIAVRSAQAFLTPRSHDPAALEAERNVRELLERKRVVLQAMKQSELDLATGKVAEAEYELTREAAEAKAVGLMREIDTLKASFRYSQRVDRDLEEVVAERAEADDRDDRRGQSAPEFGGRAREGDALASLQASAKRAGLLRKQLSSGEVLRCRSCQAEIDPADKFCASCGGAQSRTCPGCGAEARGAGNFCRTCGHALDNTIAASAP